MPQVGAEAASGNAEQRVLRKRNRSLGVALQNARSSSAPAMNTAMFALEIGAGLMSGSASLQADALEPLGDAMNYGLSLIVVGMSLRARAGAALLKGISMGVLGLWILSVTGWHALAPDAAAGARQRACRRCRPARQRGFIRAALSPPGAATPICIRPGYARATYRLGGIVPCAAGCAGVFGTRAADGPIRGRGTIMAALGLQVGLRRRTTRARRTRAILTGG